jgi:hypothetical protein
VVSLAKPTQKLLAEPILLLVAFSLVLGARAAIAFPTKTVLVLYSNNRLVPGNVAVDHGLSDALMSDGERSVRTYSEFLDRPEFSGDAYEDLEAAYLHGKYATSPPDARASSAPVYGPFDTFMGTSIVGGRMPGFEEMGTGPAVSRSGAS